MMHALQIHLLYASIVWVVAWLMTALPRIRRANGIPRIVGTASWDSA